MKQWTTSNQFIEVVYFCARVLTEKNTSPVDHQSVSQHKEPCTFPLSHQHFTSVITFFYRINLKLSWTAKIRLLYGLGNKFGLAANGASFGPIFGEAESSSNTMWPGPRTTSMPSFILIHPTVLPQYTNVTDSQTDTQTDRTTVR